MDIFTTPYNAVLQKNAMNLSTYENYKISHEKLYDTLKTFSESLNHQILVPVCSRILMRGTLLHTNEVLVSLGSNYFVKCLSKHARDIAQRRSKKAEMLISDLRNERDFLQRQVDFSVENVFATDCKEIIEPYEEDVEKEWNREHLLKRKESRRIENMQLRVAVDHRDIMDNLELLELQEEIDTLYDDNHLSTPKESLPNSESDSNLNNAQLAESSREFMLKKKLADLRQRKKTKCETEEDLVRRLDRLEEEEEIEDELDRLHGINNSNPYDCDELSSENEDIVIEHLNNNENIKMIDSKETPSNDTVKAMRRVSFAEETQYNEDVITLNISFSHTDALLPMKKIAPEKTIEKPSDVYTHFPQCFTNIDKKPSIKNCHKVKEEMRNDPMFVDLYSCSRQNTADSHTRNSDKHNNILGNIIENTDTIQKGKISSNFRPPSKFKTMRMANKK